MSTTSTRNVTAAVGDTVRTRRKAAKACGITRRLVTNVDNGRVLCCLGRTGCYRGACAFGVDNKEAIAVALGFCAKVRVACAGIRTDRRSKNGVWGLSSGRWLGGGWVVGLGGVGAKLLLTKLLLLFKGMGTRSGPFGPR